MIILISQLSSNILNTNLKADPNLPDIKGITPFISAVINDNTEAVKCLLLTGKVDPYTFNINSGIPPLHYALFNNNKEITNLLIQRCFRADYVDSQGMTALHHTLIQGNMEGFIHLLEYCNDPNIINHQDQFGRTPLHLAIQSGNTQAISSLLEKTKQLDLAPKETLEKKNSADQTPLDLAVLGSNTEILTSLFNFDRDEASTQFSKHCYLPDLSKLV